MDDELVLKPTPKAKASFRKGPGSDVHDDLVEFVLLAIKAAIHHFLFQRKIYPERWFKSERVFLTYTQACRHPSVREYVSEATGSIKESLSAGHVDTVCVGIQFPGCAQHEMLCIHPTILLQRQTESRPPWEDIDDALRGLLLQLQHSNFTLPPPQEGATFRIAVQTQQAATLPDQDWAFFEDPIAAAIAAAQAPPAQLSHADQQTASLPRHSISGADTAPLGSLQSPYTEAQHSKDAQHSAQHSTEIAAAAVEPAPVPDAALPPAADTNALANGPSAQQHGPHSMERMHEVGFGSGAASHGGLPPQLWDSQQSQGVQSQTQAPPEQASNSTQRLGAQLQRVQLQTGPSQAVSVDEQLQQPPSGKRRLSPPGDGEAEPPAKAPMHVVAAGGGMTADGPGAGSPLLAAVSAHGEHEHGGRPSPGDTESYGTEGCPTFQAAQIVHQHSAELELPLTGQPSVSSGDPPADGGSPGGSAGDTLIEGGSPERHATSLHAQPSSGHAAAVEPVSGAAHGLGKGTRGGLQPATSPLPEYEQPVGAAAASGSISGSPTRGDTLIEAPDGGAGSGAGGRNSAARNDDEATSPCDSPGEPAAASAEASDAREPPSAGGAVVPGDTAAVAGEGCETGERVRVSDGGTVGDSSPGGRAAGRSSDGEPDYFADLLGAGLFRGFGQQVEPAASPSAASDGGLGDSPVTGDAAQAATTPSPSAAEPGSSTGAGADAAVEDQDIPPSAAAAEMVLKPLVDTCIPGVLEIRANVFHLRRRGLDS